MLPSSVVNYDWYRPRIRFVRVPRTSLDILGPFESKMRALVGEAAEKSGRQLPDDPSFVFMPVHELQISNIASKFHDVEILHPDISLQALAQSSIRFANRAGLTSLSDHTSFPRTVLIPELPGYSLKLAVGVKISSALRTVSHFTANFGPRFSMDIVPRLHHDPKILSVEREPASAVYHSDNPELAKHLTAILREEFEPEEGQALIVCASLLEMDHAGTPSGVPAVEHAFGLDTEEKRVSFLDR